MAFAHRLVVVLGFFGSLYMFAMVGGFKMHAEALPWVVFGPAGVVATFVYPVAWLFTGGPPRY